MITQHSDLRSANRIEDLDFDLKGSVRFTVSLAMEQSVEMYSTCQRRPKNKFEDAPPITENTNLQKP
jgi:hypothetical protein